MATIAHTCCTSPAKPIARSPHYAEAVVPLEAAADLAPENIPIRLALAWCYKHVDRLDLAIQSLERAMAVDDQQAILHYNLACYWSLAGDAEVAIRHLA